MMEQRQTFAQISRHLYGKMIVIVIPVVLPQVFNMSEQTQNQYVSLRVKTHELRKKIFEAPVWKVF